MKKQLYSILLLTIFSCGEIPINHEVSYEGVELSGKVNWDSIAGTYLMDKKSLKGLNLSEHNEFYLIINKDSTYYINKYMDDDTLKIVNQYFTNKIYMGYSYDKNKIKDSLKYYEFADYPSRYQLLIKENKSTKKPFVMGLYFPDLSYDPNALNDLAYVLKYERVSNVPMRV